MSSNRSKSPPRPRTPERAAVPPPADPEAGLDGKIPATERSGLKPGCESHNSVSSLTSSSRQRAPTSPPHPGFSWRITSGRSIPVLFEGVPTQQDPLLTSGFTASPVFWPPIRSVTGVFERRSEGACKDWLLMFTVHARFTIAVNKVPIVNVGLEFEAEALRVLRSIPELAVTVDNERDPRGDAAIRYAGVDVPVALEFKTRVSSAAAHQIVHQAKQHEMPKVVIAAEMTGRAREILDGAGIGSIDGLGNVRLELPGLLMRISGTTRPRRPAVPTRLSGRSSLVAQAILLDVERSWHVSDLAQRCGVSAGLAHRVLRRLEDEGVVAADGTGPRKARRLSNPAALLDLWAEEHRDRPTRRPVFLLAQTTDQMIDRLCEGLETAAVDYALTGAAAAARIAPFVTGVPVAEVWLSSMAATSEVCNELGATPVESGPNVVLLQERDDAPLAFRTRENGVWTANVFRLYVDTRRDTQRGREQSDHLRREVIGF